MQTKTQDLTGPALDWAVAKCEGHRLKIQRSVLNCKMHAYELDIDNNVTRMLAASTSWSQGGPIIERERIGLDHYPDGNHPNGGEWSAATNEGTVESFGPTPLIAAMRCYVASKLGDEIEIPEELR